MLADLQEPIQLGLCLTEGPDLVCMEDTECRYSSEVTGSRLGSCPLAAGTVRGWGSNASGWGPVLPVASHLDSRFISLMGKCLNWKDFLTLQPLSHYFQGMVHTTAEFIAVNSHHPKCFCSPVNTKILFVLSSIMLRNYGHYASHVCKDATKLNILFKKELL